MLKVKPLFPLSTKDKQTSTFAQGLYDNYRLNQTSTSWQVRTRCHQNSSFNISRLVKLSKPRISVLKQTMFTQTSPNFHEFRRKSPEDRKPLPLWSYNSQTLPSNLPNQTKHINLSPVKNKVFYNYPKIEPKRPIEQNHKIQQNKQNQLIMMLTSKKVLDKKCKTLINQTPYLLKQKIKVKKQKSFDPQQLKSSDLANIYSSLYNMYQKVPFDQQGETEPILVDLVESVQQQVAMQEVSNKQIQKEQKSSGIKKLDFEKNLRKEIKSLTRDTDHILSLEFRDIREVNIR